ncbi:hypothetical protein GCM10027280_44040 [Micromonospora polyrhachis]|uniref:PepSY domain-containing protein n=1 Tax=Micromonospora polyrhachis TaxID=1282883 RepID=A0A7W7WRI5_9ACTN|nr:PepSY domain-containing protein [Micromonospora polyrhachis]MBB4961336.1 hypothetical protein [Micromonospora polyrhachis]
MARRSLLLLVGGTLTAVVVGTPVGAALATPGASSSATVTTASGVTARQAVEIARGYVGGGRLVEVELDHEHGRAVWDVEIAKSGVCHEVDVDRVTGAVVGADQDSPDDDGSCD